MKLHACGYATMLHCNVIHIIDVKTFFIKLSAEVGR